MKKFFKNIYYVLARFFKLTVKNFFKRSYMKCVVLFTTVLTLLLNKMLQHLINLKGLDYPLITLKALYHPPPQPTVKDVVPEKKIFGGSPYIPSWMADSVKDLSKHPIMQSRVEFEEAERLRRLGNVSLSSPASEILAVDVKSTIDCDVSLTSAGSNLLDELAPIQDGYSNKEN